MFDIEWCCCMQVRQLMCLITNNSPSFSRVKLLCFPVLILLLFITVRQLMRLIHQISGYLGLGRNILPCSFQRLKGPTWCHKSLLILVACDSASRTLSAKQMPPVQSL